MVDADGADGSTIFALSSGQPPAAIAIIRVSGPEAGNILNTLIGRTPEARRASVANICDPVTFDLIDTALVFWFPGPETATGEDLAEFHVHGGRAVVRALELTLDNFAGLRRAEAGEFTRRAYLNGRMDLAEAEGLSDLLFAETEHQRKSAISMASGRFSKAIEVWREECLRLSAFVEAELDFSDEDDVPDAQMDRIGQGTQTLHDEMEQLLARPSAEKMRDGIKVVLGGPPNSGKSTLLNALVDRDAAIVSDIAGTTRDVIEVPIELSGMPFVFLDTAGVRDSGAEAIEQIGIERARSAFEAADIILWLGPEGEGPVHERLVEIDARSDVQDRQLKSSTILSLSALTGDNMGRLYELLVQLGSEVLPAPGEFAVNQRQRNLIQEAVATLDQTMSDLKSGQMDLLIVGEQLRLVRLSLDALTGRSHTEDMLDTLFGKFCIGK